MSEEIKSQWERQRFNGKLESKLAYDLFLKFLEMPRPRMIIEFHEKLQEENQRVSINTLNNYSSKFNWFKRAGEYDKFLDEKRLEITIETNKKLGEKRNEWILNELEDLKQRQSICKANIGLVSRKIKKLLKTDNNDLNQIEQLNNILTNNNRSYNDISNQIMKLLGEDKVDNKSVTINNINHQSNGLKDFTDALKEWYGEE